MEDIRKSIIVDRFPDFIKEFIRTYFHEKSIPKWIVDALASVNVQL